MPEQVPNNGDWTQGLEKLDEETLSGWQMQSSQRLQDLKNMKN